MSMSEYVLECVWNGNHGVSVNVVRWKKTTFSLVALQRDANDILLSVAGVKRKMLIRLLR